MSRNTEKAQSMLYRFREQQAEEMGLIDAGRTRRPRDISSVTSVALCEKWRSQVVREISRKISKIQDPALSDFQIRDLNDEINKLMKEKHVWEIRLKNIGGPNYLHLAKSSYDAQGNSLPSTRGYKYFGRARDLPGVKELFEQQAQARMQRAANAKKNSDKQAVQSFSAKYYGFFDDSSLVAQEKEYNNFIDVSVGEPNSSIVPPFDPPSIDDVETFLIERKRKLLEKMYL